MQSADYRRSDSAWQTKYYTSTPLHICSNSPLSLSFYRAGMVLIVLLSLVPRLWKLAETDMWTDEVLTALRVEMPLDNSLDTILAIGNQTPLYYLALRLLPESSPMWLRLPSVLLGLLDIVLLIHLVAVLYGDRVLALQLGAWVAAHPLHVMLSRTARYYTLLMALALIAMGCFILIARGRRTTGLWAVLGLSSMLAYLLHYTALALLGAQLSVLALTMRHDRRLLWRWGIVQALAVLPMVGWVLLTLWNYDSGGYRYLIQGITLPDLPLTFLNLTVGFDGDGSWWVLPGLVAAVVGLIGGLVVTAQKFKAGDEQTEAGFWLLLAVLPVPGLFFMSALTGVQYRDRYFLVAMPAILLLTLWGWQRYAPRLQQVGFAVMLLTSLGLTGQIFQTGAYQRSDWEGIASYVGEHYQPGDVVLFERVAWYEAFRRYFHGDQAVLEHSVVLNDTPDPAVFEQQATRIWVVYQIRHEDLHRQGWLRDTDPFVPQLSPISDWLIAHRDAIVQSTPFDGAIVFLLPGKAAAPPAVTSSHSD